MVMTVEFQLDGQNFVGINGGPEFKFDEAVSFEINCEDQDEVDYYWDPLIRRRRGEHVRLAQGPVRAVLAGRADGMQELFDDPDPERALARDAGDAQDEQARHRGAAPGGRGRSGHQNDPVRW